MIYLDFWLLWLERYYPDLFGKAKVTAELAAKGLGIRGHSVIETDLWEELVPETLREGLLRKENFGTGIRPLDNNAEIMVGALARDVFLFKDNSNLCPNSTAFV